MTTNTHDAIAELIREAKAEAWDEAQSGLYIYEGGIAAKSNPYKLH